MADHIGNPLAYLADWWWWGARHTVDYFKFWSDIGHRCISLGLPFAIKTFLSVTVTTLVLPLVIGT